MMTTTPPPSSRVRTPPTPLHGPKHDSYEPYSPRRSSRISSRHEQNQLGHHLHRSPVANPSSGSHQNGRANMNEKASAPASISTPKKRSTIKGTSSQHFSPPSSPISPADNTATPARHRPNTAARFERRLNQSSAEPDSDFDMSDQLTGGLNGNRPGLLGMLPTPAKTPKKRGLHDGAQLHSTARVLFPNRPATVEEAMPTPRKARKGKHAGFTLDSLEGDAQDGDQIPIYTDSKERIPEEDEGEDNPFLARRSNRRVAPTSDTITVKRTRTRTKHGMSKEVDEAVERGEGLVYVFRGKKMFRRFDETNQGMEEEQGDDTNLGDTDLSHHIGDAASKRLTRTSLKPRLLFPPEETSPDPDDVDEEAVTDIEGPAPVSDVEEVATPVKQSFHPATPPTTGRKRKSHDAAAGQRDVGEAQDHPMGLDGAIDYLRLPEMGGGRKKMSPFDTWRRTKPGATFKPSEAGSSRAVSAKRQAETLEKHGGSSDAEPLGGSEGVRGKRSRSGPA